MQNFDELDTKITPKTSEMIRNKFISKLAYSKVWEAPNQKSKAYQTLIIIDWDDTIFCTSQLKVIN